MVSDLIKLYLENFDCLDDNSKHEIFDQICSDELNETNLSNREGVVYDYEILFPDKIIFNMINKDGPYTITIHIDKINSLFLGSKLNYYYGYIFSTITVIHNIIMSVKLYSEIMEKIKT